MDKHPVEHSHLYSLLAWFHAVIQEHLCYIPISWTKIFEFNNAVCLHSSLILHSPLTLAISSRTLPHSHTMPHTSTHCHAIPHNSTQPQFHNSTLLSLPKTQQIGPTWSTRLYQLLAQLACTWTQQHSTRKNSLGGFAHHFGPDHLWWSCGQRIRHVVTHFFPRATLHTQQLVCKGEVKKEEKSGEEEERREEG
jgi:hypothetical protein